MSINGMCVLLEFSIKNRALPNSYRKIQEKRRRIDSEWQKSCARLHLREGGHIDPIVLDHLARFQIPTGTGWLRIFGSVYGSQTVDDRICLNSASSIRNSLRIGIHVEDTKINAHFAREAGWLESASDDMRDGAQDEISRFRFDFSRSGRNDFRFNNDHSVLQETYRQSDKFTLSCSDSSSKCTEHYCIDGKHRNMGFAVPWPISFWIGFSAFKGKYISLTCQSCIQTFRLLGSLPSMTVLFTTRIIRISAIHFQWKTIPLPSDRLRFDDQDLI